VFIEPEDEVYDIVERPHQTTITVKKGLQMTDDIVGHYFDIVISWTCVRNLSMI
jgi:hypothetical protein